MTTRHTGVNPDCPPTDAPRGAYIGLDRENFSNETRYDGRDLGGPDYSWIKVTEKPPERFRWRNFVTYGDARLAGGGPALFHGHGFRPKAAPLTDTFCRMALATGAIVPPRRRWWEG